jgi:hypothetical protein
MWVRVLVFLIFLPTAISAQGWEQGHANRYKIYLQKFLKTNDETDDSGAKLFAFVDQLEQRNGVSTPNREFLRTIFNRVHRKFLKTYEDYVPFGNLFSSGSYNCLTAAALYALILDHFGYDYHVMETNYHIFILVATEDGKVLLETTDPQYGFVTNADEIAEKIKRYQEHKIEVSSGKKSIYKFQFELFNEVALEEITGLLYYNLAIDAYNKKEIDQSVSFLDKASWYYKSERIEEFSRVILLTLLHSDLEATTKEAYLNKIKSLAGQAVL